MLELTLERLAGKPMHVLLVGAHSDDIEIGCGGALLELLARNRDASLHWIVLSAEGERAEEARRGERALLREVARAHVVTRPFRNAYFPSEWAAIKDYFEEIKHKVKPDVVFSHLRDDLHQDHRVVGELVWNTFRDHLILEYEIPKYEGDLGRPNFYVPLHGDTVERKVQVLMETFASQRSKQWFTEETFRALMRLRGIECNSPSGYAEAFVARKVRLSHGWA